MRTAAALQAPGNPISEVSPEVLAYTNEKLHQDLEVQKVGMGIRAVIPPSPAEQYMKALRRRAADAGLDVEKLKAAPAPVPISGSTPRFLAAPPKDRQP